MRRIILAAALLLFAACHVSAQHYQVLHSFSGYPNDASYVVSSLVLDQQGNLYGTSAGGGAGIGPQCSGTGCGTVFELSPNANGTWKESLLYSFCSVYNGTLCSDGEAPWAGMILDSTGNLYGTTTGGGSQGTSDCGDSACGTVFQLSPPAAPGGTWTQSVLYEFCSNTLGGKCLDGDGPQAPLVFDNSGNLYGTADGGDGHGPSESGGGIVFELSPGLNGWTERVLYNFCSLGQGAACPDGDFPYLAGVTLDSLGNLFGTTFNGGSTSSAGNGVVYKLSPKLSGWRESVLAVFPSPTQFYGLPSGGVALDPAGNLYGSFEFPHGGVFRLNPENGSKSVFAFNGSDGQQPIGGVTLDLKHPVLYGTTSGNVSGIGDIYEIDAQGKETVLYTFCSQPNCTDGYLPWATLIMDKSGNLYGTTEFGGEYGQGVVFELTP